MKTLLTILVALFLSSSLFGQISYEWQPIQNARNSSLYMFHVEDGIYAGYLTGKNRFTYSQDKGQSWTIVNDQINEDILDLIDSEITSTAIYFNFGWKRIYKLDLETDAITLIHETSTNFFNDILVKDETLYYIDLGQLHTLHLPTQTITSTDYSGFKALHHYNGNILLLNKSDKVLQVIDEQLNPVTPKQNIDINSSNDFHSYLDKLYVQVGSETKVSEDLGQTWNPLYNSSIGGFFQFGKGTLANSSLDRFLLLDLVSGNIIKDHTTQGFESDQLYNDNGEILFYNHKMDYHYSIDTDGSLLQLPTDIDNPSTTKVIALDQNTAYFEFFNPVSYMAHENEWTESPSYIDLHLNKSQDIIGTRGDSIYLSSDQGYTFTGTHEIRTGLIKEDTNGKLIIFNEDYYFVSEDDGYTWDNDNRPNYVAHFTLNLEGLNHIFPIDNNFYGLSESALVLKMGNSSATGHAKFPWTGNQYYKSFIVNKSTEPFVLYYEVGAVMMRKLENEDEEEVEMPIQADELIIDHNDVLYLYDNKQIFYSKNKGDDWIEITGNLPDSIEISHVDIAKDGTIFVASQSTVPYKLKFGITSNTIDNADLTNKISVYPNPASDRISIETQKGDEVDFSIYNQMGNKVLTGNLSTDRFIDIDILKNGIYILRLDADGFISNHKFLKL